MIPLATESIHPKRVVIVICVMQAPKIHNLSAEMKRKRTLKAQTKVVAA